MSNWLNYLKPKTKSIFSIPIENKKQYHLFNIIFSSQLFFLSSASSLSSAFRVVSIRTP